MNLISHAMVENQCLEDSIQEIQPRYRLMYQLSSYYFYYYFLLLLILFKFTMYVYINSLYRLHSSNVAIGESGKLIHQFCQIVAILNYKMLKFRYIYNKFGEIFHLSHQNNQIVTISTSKVPFQS